MNKLIVIESLRAIAERNQVAFQFGDGLITFSGLEGSDCLEEGTENEVKEMKQTLMDCETFKIIDPERERDSESLLGFQELIEWSQTTDTLVLINDALMVCIPDSVIEEFSLPSNM